MQGSVDLNALQQSLDTSWGRSSTPKTASFSVKLSIQNSDQILASYAAIVNFGTENEMIRMKRTYADESMSVIKEVIKIVKERYKDITGSALTVKESGTSDALEITNYGVHNPKRTAYYRRKTMFKFA